MHIARVTLSCFVVVGSLTAQQSADSRYARTDEMIPMRDGVRLYTQVFSPTRTTEKFPFLLIRTPYGTGNLDSAKLVASLPELAADGYARYSRTVQVGRTIRNAPATARSEG